ncbi:MAG: c-type cytochrome [Candidatus Rokuibacteriota bacterium]
MKWVFLLCLLVVLGAGGAMGGLVGYRWLTSMQADVKFAPGELPLAQPPGTVPRSGGELVFATPQAAHAAYEKRPNPVPRTRESVARGEGLYRIYCTPCHGPEGKGDGPVTPRFIPPPDLTGPQIQARSDGHMAAYIGYGGAIMPAYGEALALSERWDLVNYVRAMAGR